jgi:predicted DsbA family dithiol-disulfide isomerase
MVQKVLESVMEDIKRAKQILADTKVLIDTAKEAGIDVSSQEISYSDLEEKIKTLEEAVNKRLAKK